MLSIYSLLHKIPFIRLILFFGLGVVAAYHGLDFKYVSIILISAVLFLILHFLIIKQGEEDVQFKHRWMFGLSIASFMFAFGMIFMHQSLSTSKSSHLASFYMGKVVSSPKLCSDSKVKCKMFLSEVSENDFNKGQNSFTVDVYLPDDANSANLKAGDSLMIATKYQSSPLRNSALGLKNNCEILFVEKGSWKVISRSDGYHVEAIREKLIDELKKKQTVLN